MPTSNERRRSEFVGAAGASSPAFLRRLTKDDLTAEAGRSLGTMRICKNKDLLVAGTHYECVYVNHDGWLLRYKILHNGSRQIIDFILPGQIIGLQAYLFNNSLYSVAAITETLLSVISIRNDR